MRTTTKEVTEQLKEHILEHFGIDYGWDNNDYVENLKYQLRSFDYLPTTYDAGVELVQGGTFLIYYNDVNKFLNDLGINPDKKEYTDKENWELYKHLIARTISSLVK